MSSVMILIGCEKWWFGISEDARQTTRVVWVPRIMIKSLYENDKYQSIITKIIASITFEKLQKNITKIVFKFDENIASGLPYA